MLYLNDHIEDINVADALKRVGAQRAAYALRYRQEHDRRLSLAVYLLLQEALKKEYGIREVPEFIYGPHGKPALKGHPEIHFNLSHCRQAALCVVSDRPVGCDVESVPAVLDMDLCRYCFNEEETAGILSSENPPLAFTKLWTRKEAYLKLTGEGLTDNLPRISVIPHPLQTFTAPDNSYAYSVCQWTE